MIQEIIRKKGKVYKAIVYVGRGKRATRTFRRKIDAREWEAAQKAEAVHGDYEREKQARQLRESLLLRDLVDMWDELHASVNIAPSTRSKYQSLLQNYILEVFGDKYVVDIQTLDVERWFARLQRDVSRSPKTLNHALNLLRGILNWGVVRFHFPRNPCDPVKCLTVDPKGFDFWSAAEIARFLTAMRDDPSYPLYVLALNTGMRLGELYALNWCSVSLERNQLLVCRTYCPKENRIKERTKGRKSRWVPINKAARAVLVELQQEAPGPDDLVLEFDYVNFTARHFKKACEQAGVRAIRFHDLRHTYASHFVMNMAKGEATLFDLQKILGHASIKTTEMYAHLSESHLAGVADVVSFEAPPMADVVPFPGTGKGAEDSEVDTHSTPKTKHKTVTA